MRLSPDTVSRIKACKGVYSVGDTAKHFRCSKSTVHDIWHGLRHTHIGPADEPDNVRTSRVSADIVASEGKFLLSQGVDKEQAAQQIGVSVVTLERHLGRNEQCFWLF